MPAVDAGGGKQGPRRDRARRDAGRGQGRGRAAREALPAGEPAGPHSSRVHGQPAKPAHGRGHPGAHRTGGGAARRSAARRRRRRITGLRAHYTRSQGAGGAGMTQYEPKRPLKDRFLDKMPVFGAFRRAKGWMRRKKGWIYFVLILVILFIVRPVLTMLAEIFKVLQAADPGDLRQPGGPLRLLQRPGHRAAVAAVAQNPRGHLPRHRDAAHAQLPRRHEHDAHVALEGGHPDTSRPSSRRRAGSSCRTPCRSTATSAWTRT